MNADKRGDERTPDYGADLLDTTTGSSRASKSVSTHCCDRMDYDLNHKCDIHQTRVDCPDALVAVVEGGYGLIVHDGGSSVIEIGFCPWCGSKLPKIDRTKRAD